MSATLTIVNNLSLPSQGITKTAKQGAAADGLTDGFDVTVSGLSDQITGSLANNTAVTVYDDSADVPAAIAYLHVWADQNCYVQLIGTGSNVTLPVLAKCPFVLAPLAANLGVLAAATTTAISTTEPVLTDLKKVVIGNYSGSVMNYVATIID